MAFEKGQKVYWSAGDQYGECTGNKKILGTKTIYEVDFNGKRKFLPESQLEAFEPNPSLQDLYKARKFNGFHDFRQQLTHIRIQGGLTNIVYSMKYGDVDFLPYQFKPVFKFITSNEGRLLIADEVGLGKTIEALYIWKELQARENAQRLLIVAPAMLRSKWKKDMEQHFGISAQIVDAGELIEYCKEANSGRNKPFALITSLQGIRYRTVEENRYKKLSDAEMKNPKYLLNKMLEDISEASSLRNLFDLTIIDEAHYLANPSTANYATAKRLNDVSRNLILLSATPVSNSQSDLFSLLRILSPSEYDDAKQFDIMFEENRNVVKLAHCFFDRPKDIEEKVEEANYNIDRISKSYYFGGDPFYEKLINNLPTILASDDLRRKTYDQIVDRYFYSNVFTRSRKRDLLDTARRSAQTVSFELNSLELDVYENCTRQLKEMCLKEHDRLYSFAIMARQRELASCIPAALEKWKYMGDIVDFDDVESGLSDFAETIETELFENTNPNKQTIPSYVKDVTTDRLSILRRNDSKFNKFLEAIKTKIEESKNNGEIAKIVVFSFYRGTLNYLNERLRENGFNPIVIMGGIDQKEKDDSLTRFREDPSVRILLSSEVGAEGLDMQFSNIEFNYDLPWNPMKLEQRIGRIDRIGQKAEKILIVNMLCSNTIEDRVLDKLYCKINIFQESIGELDEILGKLTQDIEYDLISSELTTEQKEKNAEAAIDRYYNQLHVLQSVEESAGLSKAYSDSIKEHVENAERNSRYIKREDLINYMSDFFAYDANGSHFAESRNNTWILEFSDQDRDDFKNYLVKNNLTCPQAHNPRIVCTFPQGKRTTYSGACNIDINHSIIRWVFDNTKKALELKNTSCCFAIEVSSAFLKDVNFCKGAYALYINHFECSGLKKKNELCYYVCNIDTQESWSINDSEYLISQSLFHGTDVQNISIRLKNLDSVKIDSALAKCDLAATEHADSVYEELENDRIAIYKRMITKTKNFYEDKIKRLEEQIAQAEFDYHLMKLNNEYNEGIENRYKIIPANRARLNNLKQQYESSLREVESNNNIDPIFEEMAVGILFVI